MTNPQPAIFRKLAHHFLTNTETITFNGTWGAGPSRFPTYTEFVQHWTRKHMGKPMDVGLTPIKAVETVLAALGSGSRATFHKADMRNPNAVMLEIVDPSGVVRYFRAVYHDHEDPEWFGISVRIACESAVAHLRKQSA